MADVGSRKQPYSIVRSRPVAGIRLVIMNVRFEAVTFYLLGLGYRAGQPQTSSSTGLNSALESTNSVAPIFRESVQL